MQDHMLIEGGRALVGSVAAGTAKNAVLPIMAAAVLTEEPCVLENVPNLRDVAVMSEILRSLGADVHAAKAGAGLRLTICAKNVATHAASDVLMGELRSSIFVMGALLGRLGRATVAYPGGCSIGPRPIDLHLMGLRALGARIEERFGRIDAIAPALVGTEIQLDLPSVGATENIMMAAVHARGTTVIRNPAKEPEIVDLQVFLNTLGARIRGAGLDAIVIEGTRDRLRGTTYTPIPDRIEAGTLMIAAAITGGEVQVTGVVPEHFSALSAKLREAGVRVEEGSDLVMIRSQGRPRGFDCKTLPYPGFPTDLQPPLMSLATVADGTSVITETIYERRFNHAEELRRMGANIKIESRSAIIKGVENLSGARVRAHDLRAGAALVLAGLAAEGSTVVSDIAHIDRGYDSLELKLRKLGASIRRVEL